MRRTLAIETGIDPDGEARFLESALDAGWRVLRVANIPFTETFVTGDPNLGHPLNPEDLNNPDTFFFGSIEATRRVGIATKWKAHANWSALRCSAYYPLLADHLFQMDFRILTLGELRTRRNELFSTLGEDGVLFIRPDGNDKTFTGQLIYAESFEENLKVVNFYDPPPSLPIVVARPQRIHEESRFLIVDGRVVTGSAYRSGGKSIRVQVENTLFTNAERILAYCLAQGFNPSPSWVLDLATQGDRVSILEVGATSCCGLYATDTNAFAKALFALKEL